MKNKRIEQRVLPLDVVMRAGDGAETGKLIGHAAVFNQWATINEPWFGDLYEEQVAPGAFRKTLAEQDIRALWNHDANIVLGRMKAGTLELSEDETGLAATITPPDNAWGRPVLDAVRRGDVSGMSIAFQVVKEDWVNPDRKAQPGALRKRTIKEAKLFEVSPVTFPAYPQTDIGARAEDGDDDSKLLPAFRAARLAELGLPLTDTERAAVRQITEFMARVSGEPDAVPGEDESLWTRNHSSITPGNEPESKNPGLTRDGHEVDVDHSEAARARKLQMMKLEMEARR